jgi:GNAT superfamily N-acetyltransferase
MSFSARLATPADNPKIQALVNKTTAPGLAIMSFQRAPDFFVGAHTIGQEVIMTVIEDTERPGHLAGMSVISGRELFINGEKRRAFYSGDVKVDAFYRRKGIGSRLYAEQRAHLPADTLLQGIILSANKDAVTAQSRSVKGTMPDIWSSHKIETSLIYTRSLKPRIPAGVVIRAANAADVPRMQAFFDQEAPRRNGYPVYDFAKLLAGDPYYAGIRFEGFALAMKGDQIIGMMGGWDQKSFKQTRIVGYKPAVAFLRPFYNLYATIFGGIKLPAIGGMLNYLTLHTRVIANDDPAIFQALIDWIMVHDGRKYDALACAVVAGDPLFSVPSAYKRQRLYSNHHWLGYDEDPTIGIDDRPLYIELGRV